LVQKLLIYMLALIIAGCSGSTPSPTVHDKALYKGKLGRYDIYLNPQNNNSWGKDFAKLVQTELLDTHFNGDPKTIFIVEAHANRWHATCNNTKDYLLTYSLEGSLNFTIKTIRPNKNTYFVSENIPFSKHFKGTGACDYRYPDGSTNEKQLFKKFSEDIIMNATKLLELQMSQSEGKSIDNDNFKEISKNLFTDDTASTAIFVQTLGQGYVSVVKGVGSTVGSVMKGVGEVGAAYNTEHPSYNNTSYGSQPTAFDMMTQKRQEVQQMHTDAALMNSYTNSSSSSYRSSQNNSSSNKSSYTNSSVAMSGNSSSSQNNTYTSSNSSSSQNNGHINSPPGACVPSEQPSFTTPSYTTEGSNAERDARDKSSNYVQEKCGDKSTLSSPVFNVKCEYIQSAKTQRCVSKPVQFTCGCVNHGNGSSGRSFSQ
jgi:hypothetical protein